MDKKGLKGNKLEKLKPNIMINWLSASIKTMFLPGSITTCLSLKHHSITCLDNIN